MKNHYKVIILILSLLSLALFNVGCMGNTGIAGQGTGSFDIAKIMGNPIVDIILIIAIVWWMMRRNKK